VKRKDERSEKREERGKMTNTLERSSNSSNFKNVTRNLKKHK